MLNLEKDHRRIDRDSASETSEKLKKWLDTNHFFLLSPTIAINMI